ncbi:30S ribosomal subunit protein S9 [Candidatus Hodgkinia cicadicola]|nr:30S ribosomal subunit protein S9 [Candidatus Hodgkinia cicadicola]
MYRTQVVFGEIRASAKRKAAIVQVRLRVSKSSIFNINSRPVLNYFRDETHRAIALDVFKLIKCFRFNVKATARGGGASSQAHALKLALLKCMLYLGNEIKEIYKNSNTFTTDARRVERKKYGLAKARRSYQFSKR